MDEEVYLLKKSGVITEERAESIDDYIEANKSLFNQPVNFENYKNMEESYD